MCASNLDNGFVATGVDYDLSGESRLGLGIDLASAPVAFGGRAVPIVFGSIDYDLVSPADEDGHWALGWEISFLDLVQARIGLEDDDATDVSAWGVGLGWEFGRWMVRGDYAHESWQTFFLGEMHTDTYGLAAGMRL
jgi:hypothetical protein